MEKYNIDIFLKTLERKLPENYKNKKVQQMIRTVIDIFEKNNQDKIYHDDLFEALTQLCPDIDEKIILANGNFSKKIRDYAEGKYSFEYQMLNRLKLDCDYYLGHGNRNEKNLWAGTVQEQIQTMKKYYNLVPFKPEWLTKKEICRYECEMTTLKSLDDLRDFLEYHGWTVKDYGEDWDIEKYSPAGEDFFFSIIHNKSLKEAVEEICEYARDFDPMEHAEIWTPEKNGAPDRETLIKDAKAIQGMLNEIEYVLKGCKVKEKNKCEERTQ